jgi:hypothetical protein
MIDIIVDENGLLFNRLEKEIYAFGCQIAREMLKNILEALDKKLAEERDKSMRLWCQGKLRKAKG